VIYWSRVIAALDIYTELLALVEANYPETLGAAYVVNGTIIS